MTEKCFDEGVIQAFLDGELGLDQADRVTRHIALCDACALSVAAAEEEMEFAFAALDNEFNTLVPTERLWTKINNSIETEARNKSVWQSVFSFLTNPSSVAFASLIIVFGLFAGLYGLQNGSGVSSEGDLAVSENKARPTPVTVDVTESPGVPGGNSLLASTGGKEIEQPAPPVSADNRAEDSSDFKASNAFYVKTDRIRPKTRPQPAKNSPDEVYVYETLAAEDSYVKTISTLEKTVNSRKDEVLRPSARFAFEKDMAVADDTIRKMKEEIRRNPKNEAARVLLRTSYQNKINLLNSVAEKTELMASLN